MGNPVSTTHGDGAYRHGCRCDVCRAGHVEAQKRWRATKLPLDADDPRHGSYSTYQNHRCRCGACRFARLTYERGLADRRKRAREKAHDTPPA
jgi:hypothetical protein